MGLGIHGEPGAYKSPVKPAKEIVAEILARITSKELNYYPVQPGTGCRAHIYISFALLLPVYSLGQASGWGSWSKAWAPAPRCPGACVPPHPLPASSPPAAGERVGLMVQQPGLLHPTRAQPGHPKPSTPTPLCRRAGGADGQQPGRLHPSGAQPGCQGGHCLRAGHAAGMTLVRTGPLLVSTDQAQPGYQGGDCLRAGHPAGMTLVRACLLLVSSSSAQPGNQGGDWIRAGHSAIEAAHNAQEQQSVEAYQQTLTQLPMPEGGESVNRARLGQARPHACAAPSRLA